MDNENIIKLNSSEDMVKAIGDTLKRFKEEGAYITDRAIYAGFGDTLRDAVNAYSKFDTFLERVYKESFVNMIEKEVSYYEQGDLDIMDTYAEEMQALQNIANLTVEADENEAEYHKMVCDDLSHVIEKIKPKSEKRKLPFFINKMTGQEVPLIPLKDTTEKAIDEWAERLTMYCEQYKAINLPMSLSTTFNPNGLNLMVVNSVYWYDIIVR